MSSHVFISYSREDLRYVQALINHLTAAGINVWLDKKIATGSRWDTEIKEKIDTAVAVVVVMSPAADESGWVTNEIHHAIEIQKPILPLLLEGKPFFTLTRIHHEDVRGGQMPGESFMAALLALRETEPATPPQEGKKKSLGQRLSRPFVLAVTGTIIVVLLVVVAIVVQPWRNNQQNQQPTGTNRRGDSNFVISTSGAAVESIAFKSDGRVLATGGGNDLTIRLWNPTTGQLIRPLIGQALTSAVVFSPNGDVVVSNGELAMWNPNTGEKVGQLEGGGWGIAFSPDSRTLAVGDAFNTVRLWDAGTRRLLRTMPLTNSDGTVVETVTFSSDGKVLAAGGHEGTVKLWNPATGDHIRTIVNDGGAYWMSFTPDGSTLFVASGVGPVRSWNTATGALLGTLAEATKAALSPDGTLLATAGRSDYYVRLWDSRTGELMNTFAGHTNTIKAMAFSADGRRLATGGDDQTVRLWRID